MKKASNTPLNWSEDKLQSQFYIWFHNKFPHLRGLLFSVPNGGGRSGLEGKVLKATGLFPGVADMIFLWKGVAYFLELKRPDGRNSQSPKQKYWQELVGAQGFSYEVYNDLKELQYRILTIMTADDKKDKDNWPHKQAKLEL